MNPGAVAPRRFSRTLTAERESVQSDRIIPLGDPNPWLIDAWRALETMARLEENWDSYGSRPLSMTAVEAASRVLYVLRNRRMPAPQLVPVSGGGLQFEWQEGNRELELEVFPDGRVGFLLVQDSEPLTEGELPHGATREVQALADWLTRG